MRRSMHFFAMVSMLHSAQACCRGSRPDPTFFSAEEYDVTAVSPDRSPISGGARIKISGVGFSTNFFEGGNFVYM